MKGPILIVLRVGEHVLTEATILAAGGGMLRLAVPGHADVVELQRVGERWMWESGAAVEVEAMILLFEADQNSPGLSIRSVA